MSETYLLLHKVRCEYSDDLSDSDISSIIERWNELVPNIGDHESRMTSFSCMKNMRSLKRTLQELKLHLSFLVNRHLKDASEYVQTGDMCHHLFVQWAINILELGAPYEVEESTYELRKNLCKEFLDKLIKIVDITKGLQFRIKLRNDILQKYPHELLQYEIDCWNLLSSYIKNE